MADDTLNDPEPQTFSARLLEANELDLAGFQAIELCNQFNRKLQKLMNKYVDFIAQRGDGPTSHAEKQAENNGGSPWSTAKLLRELDELSEWSVRTLSTIVDRLIPTNSETTQIELNDFLKQAFKYYHSVYGGTEILSPRVGMSGVHKVVKSDIPPFEPIFIESCPIEVAKLSVYLLSYISGLHDELEQIRISLSYETIGEGTAILVPGYFPGRYARIILHHPGQTLAAHMMAGMKQQESALDGDTMTNPALQLMKLQANRIGGRVAVQSSMSDGTTISVYLPTEWLLQEGMPENIRAAFVDPRRSGLQLPGATRKPVLLIGSHREKLAEIERMVKFLGYPINVKLSDEVLNKLQNALNGENGLPSLSDVAELHETNIVVLNLEDNDKAGQSLATQIENHLPYETMLVITDDDPDTVSGPEQTYVLNRPYDIITLKRALEGILTSGV